jgi:hypothetical protein
MHRSSPLVSSPTYFAAFPHNTQVTTEPVAELNALSIGPDQLALKANVDARLALQARAPCEGGQS